MTHSSNEGEFLAHLKKLDDVGARINTAIGVADSTMNPLAFGILGAPLAGICAAAQAIASDAITKASDAAADHYRRFLRCRCTSRPTTRSRRRPSTGSTTSEQSTYRARRRDQGDRGRRSAPRRSRSAGRGGQGQLDRGLDERGRQGHGCGRVPGRPVGRTGQHGLRVADGARLVPPRTARLAHG
jgi:hypothetical protein